jgi:hypothetical protein
MQGVCAWKLRERRSDYCDQAHSCDRIICQKYVQTAESTVATTTTVRLLRVRKMGRPAEMVRLGAEGEEVSRNIPWSFDYCKRR